MARRRTLKTRTELAHALRITAGTLTRWERDGCPVARKAPRGRPSLFDQAAVERWRDARDAALKASGTSLEAERARLAAAQAARVEMQNKARSGELIEVGELLAVWTEILATIRSRLLALPAALAEELVRAAASAGARGVYEALERAIHSALEELSAWRPPAGPETTDAGAARAEGGARP